LCKEVDLGVEGVEVAVVAEVVGRGKAQGAE
jgi:hypothetical protein